MCPNVYLCTTQYFISENDVQSKSGHSKFKMPSSEVGITERFKLTELKYFYFTIMSNININSMYSAENTSVKTFK